MNKINEIDELKKEILALKNHGYKTHYENLRTRSLELCSINTYLMDKLREIGKMDLETEFKISEMDIRKFEFDLFAHVEFLFNNPSPTNDVSRSFIETLIKTIDILDAKQ